MCFQKVLQEIQKEGKALQKVPEGMSPQESNHQELLFETSNATLHQCDDSEMYILNFKGDAFLFRACELITFKRKIRNYDIVSMLSSQAPDVELLYMPHCDRIFIFTVEDLLELRELFAGAFTMLELNSLIHRELLRKVN